MAGRKSKYNPDYHIPWVRGLAMRGCTVEEIAKEIGVAKSTLCLWVKKDPALSDALNEARDYADIKVEHSLYERALGVTVTERKTIITTDANGVSAPQRIEVTEKSYPADTTACIFWLKNRQSDRWRDKREIDLSDEIEKVSDFCVSVRRTAEKAVEDVA
ncbi:MAG: hypothetical protein IJ111_01280 [Eggerthellaceae bacterium]|nr:hypothetical protein [Eggerthellaceae bacterium]